ncbi:MAG TPA: universal stress protein [Chloroflexota bacterium]|nr:universal stress protein [Chloroflexota bacterium]
MAREPERPDPDALLARIKAEEQPRRGRLRIYLGAAPGVGKTYAMLQEAHRRKARGTDVVVGLVETHGRSHTAEQIGDLEVVPPREVPYKGVVVREMDTAAVIAHHPQVALVDELAHTNVDGSRHEKRYEDVQDLLDAGITVIATLNIQHIESLNDVIKQITGVTVRETVPDWVLDGAEQVELIDMAPEALIQRMKHGNIYPPEQAKRALDNFFTAGNLTALRDMALRATAREVEEQLSRYMRDRVGAGDLSVAVHDRIMVAVDHRRIGKLLIRRGWRIASALKADLVVVHVDPERGPRAAQTVEDERQLRANLQLADELGAQVVHLRGRVADELVAYARAQEVTQVVIGQSARGRWQEMLQGSVTHDLLRKAQGIDVLVVAEPAQWPRRERDGHPPAQ